MNDDISLKERIINNYKYNRNNYETIMNFINLIIDNNDKYETLLKNIIKEYNKDQNNKYNINTVINQILNHLYYSLMIYNDIEKIIIINKNIHQKFTNKNEENNNDKNKKMKIIIINQIKKIVIFIR